MARYYTFFTNLEGNEEMGGSHFDFDLMCSSIELFLRTNKRRKFLFVAACREEEDGTITEVVKWKEGSDVPVLDNRKKEEIS